MTGIFINYRRDDAPGVAGRLYDHLAKSFSRRDLFIDVDAIKPGLDFVKQLDTQVSQCDVLLALIGPHWLKAEDEQGGQRLQGDRDYVRIEIAAALKRDIPVIPVLINGADMPVEDELPEDLKSLSRRHALELRHTRFAADADAIAAALKDALPKRKSRWPYMAAACLVASIALGSALYLWRGSTPNENPVKVPPAPAASSQPTADNSASQPAGQPLTVAEAERRVAEAKRKIAAIKGEAPPAPAEAPSPDAKPMPGIEGITVALGNPRDGVRQAYPQAADSGSGDLSMPLEGIKFFFTKDDKVLREIMVEAPFKGSVDGVQIGDTADDVVARRGQPYAVADVYGGSGYLYRAGGNILRYDVDGKSKKITDIVQILDRP
jgi:TIR domain